jgi:hypothetical protein
MYTYSFEKLEVWVEAKDFTKSAYHITSKFPDTEKFGLVSQIRRASVFNVFKHRGRFSPKII